MKYEDKKIDISRLIGKTKQDVYVAHNTWIDSNSSGDSGKLTATNIDSAWNLGNFFTYTTPSYTLGQTISNIFDINKDVQMALLHKQLKKPAALIKRASTSNMFFYSVDKHTISKRKHDLAFNVSDKIYIIENNEIFFLLTGEECVCIFGRYIKAPTLKNFISFVLTQNITQIHFKTLSNYNEENWINIYNKKVERISSKIKDIIL